MASLSVRLAKFAPTVGDVTPRAMLRLLADLQTSQWPPRQCRAQRLEGVSGGDFSRLDAEDGRAVEPLVLGHPRPRSDPSVGAG